MFLSKFWGALYIDDPEVLCAIVSEIAINCPAKAYDSDIAIISKILCYVEDKELREKIVIKVYNKFRKLPNIGLIQIWMQRLSSTINHKENYDEQLCQIVENALLENKKSTEIWNIDWVDEQFKKEFPWESIFNNEKHKSLTPDIKPTEVNMFKTDY